MKVLYSIIALSFLGCTQANAMLLAYKSLQLDQTERHQLFADIESAIDQSVLPAELQKLKDEFPLDKNASELARTLLDSTTGQFDSELKIMAETVFNEEQRNCLQEFKNIEIAFLSAKRKQLSSERKQLDDFMKRRELLVYLFRKHHKLDFLWRIADIESIYHSV